MSNHLSAPHADRPAPRTDRPTATYPTADHLAGLEAHRQRLADLWADATPTEELPPARPLPPAAAPLPSVQSGPSRVSTRPEPTDGRETPLQDMGRPGILARPSMAWHPSLMQLAIGAALVAALLGACNVAAIQAHRQARAYCHALVVSDWERAERECRGTGEGTPVPEQAPVSAHTSPSPASPAAAPRQSSTPSALTRVTTPSTPPAALPPTPKPAWTVHGTDSPYDRTDPAASPLDLPRCTTSPDTPMPCLAHVSADSAHVTVLEEDASLTGVDRR